MLRDLVPMILRLLIQQNVVEPHIPSVAAPLVYAKGHRASFVVVQQVSDLRQSSGRQKFGQDSRGPRQQSITGRKDTDETTPTTGKLKRCSYITISSQHVPLSLPQRHLTGGRLSFSGVWWNAYFNLHIGLWEPSFKSHTSRVWIIASLLAEELPLFWKSWP